MKIMKTKKKKSSLRFSPFFCLDLGEDQKKENGHHLDSVRFSAQIPKGGHGSILRTILWYSYITGDPKFIDYWTWRNAPPPLNTQLCSLSRHEKNHSDLSGTNKKHNFGILAQYCRKTLALLVIGNNSYSCKRY